LSSNTRHRWLATALGAWLTLAAAAALAQPDVCPGNTQADAGEEIAVPILIDDPLSIVAFGLEFVFEVDVLRYDSVARSALTSAWLVFNGSENTPGTVRIGGFSISPIPTSEPDTLGYIRMTVLLTPAVSTYLFTNFEDDLAGAPDCQGEFSATNPVLPGTWGRIKGVFGGSWVSR
jgi:hypothetical protein